MYSYISPLIYQYILSENGRDCTYSFPLTFATLEYIRYLSVRTFKNILHCKDVAIDYVTNFLQITYFRFSSTFGKMNNAAFNLIIHFLFLIGRYVFNSQEWKCQIKINEYLNSQTAKFPSKSSKYYNLTSNPSSLSCHYYSTLPLIIYILIPINKMS